MSSSQLAFPDLAIQGFRGFRRLEIPELGRVTLITGKNNSGKSSILEALRIGAQKADPAVVFDILRIHTDFHSESREVSQFPDSIRDFYLSDLFYGFPAFDDDFDPIVIKASSNPKEPLELSLQVEWVAFGDDGHGDAKFVDRDRAVREELPGGPVLVARTAEGEHAVRLTNLRRFRNHIPRPHQNRLNCKVVKANGTSEALGSLWDEAVLRDEEGEVVRALQIIDPDLTSVRMIGGEHNRPGKTPFVRSRGLARYVPLRSCGDGLNRMLTLVLSMLGARNGLLLIDEFENGLHHTVQLETWRTIFQLAQLHSVQVFATTHSWDTVEAFQAAATETPEAGLLLRLTRHEDNIIPTVFVEDELQVITRSRIEVR